MIIAAVVAVVFVVGRGVAVIDRRHHTARNKSALYREAEVGMDGCIPTTWEGRGQGAV